MRWILKFVEWNPGMMFTVVEYKLIFILFITWQFWYCSGYTGNLSSLSVRMFSELIYFWTDLLIVLVLWGYDWSDLRLLSFLLTYFWFWFPDLNLKTKQTWSVFEKVIHKTAVFFVTVPVFVSTNFLSQTNSHKVYIAFIKCYNCCDKLADHVASTKISTFSFARWILNGVNLIFKY